MPSKSELETKLELQRVDLNQGRQVLEGLIDELDRALETVIAVRGAEISDMLMISNLLELVSESVSSARVLKLRLGHHAAELELAQEQAEQLHVAAYGAPAAV